MGRPAIDPLMRFCSYISKSGECWEWTAWRDKDGYGGLKVRGRMVRAHRFSYEQFKGSIPTGLFVCHTCDNPSCVNPTHLWAGTNSANIKDCYTKGRHSNKFLSAEQRKARRAKANDKLCGEKCNLSKLTADVIKTIAKDARPKKQIAKEYGINRKTVYNIQKGKTWRHLLC